MAVLLQIDGRDPVTGTVVSIRATSENDARICGLDGQDWWPVIAQLPALRYDLFDGTFGSQIETPSSSVSLSIEPWPAFARYQLADARLRLWTGAAADAWPWTLRFDGRVSAQPRIANGRASIGFAVDDRWLDAPLLATFAGTGGAEGEVALKGQVKPLSIGTLRFVPGRMIDTINNVLMLSSAAIEGVEVAFERLKRFEAPVGDFASHAALVAATIPAGAWATALGVGMVRHGAPPAGRLSYHVRGDKAGPGGWARLPGAVINRIALLSGGAGRIDATSLAAFDAARPWPISLHIPEQTTARDLIQRIAASVNAVAGVDWLGKLFVAPVGIGAPTVTLDASGASLPIVASVEQVEAGPPFWRLGLSAARTWDVHALSDVAFSALLVDRGRYDAAETYREGHIVDLANGSRWLYHATTPSSGNAPPTGVTGNVWWDQLSPATTFAGIDPEAAAKLATIATGATQNNIYRRTTDPVGTITLQDGDIWVDISAAPMIIKVRIGGTWQFAGNYVTTGSQIGVSDGATRNIITRSASAPANPQDGDWWANTSVVPALLQLRVAGLWVPGSNLVVQGSDIGVENNATRNGPERSLVRNSTFEGDAGTVPSGWLYGRAGFNGAVTIITGDQRATRGRNLALMRSNALIDSENIAAAAGELFWFDYGFITGSNRGDGVAPRFEVAAEWLGIAGNVISTVYASGPGGPAFDAPAGVRKDGKFSAVAPAGTRAIRYLIWFELGAASSGQEGLADYLGVYRDQPGADVTAAQQVTLDMPPLKVFNADYQGTLSAGSLPHTISPRVVRNGVSIKAAASTTYQVNAVACEATVATAGAAKGDVTITTFIGGSGSVDLIVFVDGIERGRTRTNLDKDKAAPPTGGTSGTTGPAGAKTQSTSTMSTLTGSAITDLSTVMRVTLAAGERLVGTAPLDFYLSGDTQASTGATCRWRYVAIGGGTPANDFAVGVASSSVAQSAYYQNPPQTGGVFSSEPSVGSSSERVEATPGSGVFNEVKTDLAAGEYDVQLFGAVNAGTRTVDFVGTATIEAKA